MTEIKKIEGFTPGPWKCNSIPVKTSNNYRTFEISGPETQTYVRDVLASEVDPNASLIAYAPEIYSLALEQQKEIIRLRKMIEESLKRDMRLNMPGISPKQQEETWQHFAKLNNL